MQASKPSSFTAYLHLSGPPAMPTTRQPRALASAPKALPTAPVAALTTTVSPALGCDDLHQAVPGGDAGHADGAQVVRQRHMGGVDLAQRARLVGIDHAVLLPAAHADHLVARLEPGERLSTTSPAVPPCITSPSGCGAA